MWLRCSALFALFIATGLMSDHLAFNQSVACGDDGATWPGFRGEQRDGHVAQLPKHLNKAELLWAQSLPSSGVGGVAANDNFVVVSSRDAKDKQDVFICLDPLTGAELWKFTYPSELNLDYGNSPRATPQIVEPWVYLLGAGGQLHCVDLDTGKAKWQKHLVTDLQGEKPPWGYAASPLPIGDKLIVQPGGNEHAVAALSANTGAVIWYAKAEQTAYASPQLFLHGQQRQLLCWDRRSLIALSPDDGTSLWSITPEGTTEFHVPMSLATRHGIVTIGEVHGACLYAWSETLGLQSVPKYQQFELAPDMHSPVIAGNLLLGVHESLFALDVENELRIQWKLDDPAFSGHTSLMVSDNRLLVVTERSELVLVDYGKGEIDKQSKPIIVGRKQLGDSKQRSLAAPALVGDVLFVRTNNQLLAVALSE